MKLYDKVEPYIWLLIICSFLYFILPISVVSFLPKYSNIITIIFVLVINVIFSFIIGMINTKKKGFSYVLPIYIGLVFIPFSLLMYNKSTVLYSVLYIVVCFVASLITYKYKK